MGSVTYVSAAGVINQATSLVVSGAGTTAETFTVYNSIASGVTKQVVQAGAGQGAGSGSSSLISLTSSGTEKFGLGLFGGSGGLIVKNPGGVVAYWPDASNLRFINSLSLQWSSSGDASGSADTSLSRVSAGVCGIGTGAAGSTAGTLQAKSVAIISPVVPATAADAGTAGAISWDSSFIYLCTASGAWKRVAIASW